MIKPLADEQKLLTALRAGDIKAFEKIFRHFHKPLWYFANELLKDGDEAEDTIQQLFLTLWERHGELLISGSIKSYLFTATKNACLKKIEKAKKTSLINWEEEDEPKADFTTDGRIAEKDLKIAIEQAINSLPEKCRLVFKMSRFSELSYQEIANELGISKKTVENQIGKALQIMRVALQYQLLLFISILGSLSQKYF
jgi:RNA polymerase sigma-70 factor (ECF subfamily)